LSNEGEQHEGIALPLPPLIYLGFLILGLAVNLYYPLSLSSSETAVIVILGLGVIACGLALGAWALSAMWRAGVSPLPWKQPARLVVDGPFRFSRNPVYVSLAIVYLGLSIALNTLWPPAFLGFALIIVDRGIILQEERFLEKKFGAGYLSYKVRVRRWI
jgi:protein-S-isoprenylcysteine O-methyltransferase Ste14